MVIDKVKQGKQNRAKGARFELKVRKDLEENGWTVDKWTNNVDIENIEIIKAKSNRYRMSSTGFPDFIAFMRASTAQNMYKVILLECKVGKYLDKTEKEKIKVLRGMGFECWVAYNEEGQIAYRKLMEHEGSSRAHRAQVRHKI